MYIEVVPNRDSKPCILLRESYRQDGKVCKRTLANLSKLPTVKAGTRLGPCVGDTRHFIAIGLNYADHARETGRTLPKYPATFLKLPRNLRGHQQPLQRPKVSHLFDWEAELGIVIGRRARHVRAADALAYVAGYTCVNDGTIRDWQHERIGDEHGHCHHQRRVHHQPEFQQCL